jgi:hypothetical protein
MPELGTCAVRCLSPGKSTYFPNKQHSRRGREKERARAGKGGNVFVELMPLLAGRSRGERSHL